MGELIALLPGTYTVALVTVGAMLLGIAAGTLGSLAVLQQRSLVGDALAHAALPGIAIAFIATGAKDSASLLAGAVISGVLAALMMVGIERTSRTRPDAAIGVVLSSFFALGIVLLTEISNTGGAQQAGLDTYLFGQAAGLVERDVQVALVLTTVGLLVVILGFRTIKLTLFDRGFAQSIGVPVRLVELATSGLLVIAIVIGLRMVGAILMVAMLIVPTVIARQLTDRLAVLLPVAGAAGAAIGVAGAQLSSTLEVPTGPVIVLIGFVAAMVTVLLAPRRGVASRAYRLYNARRRERASGVLVSLETAIHHGPPPTIPELAAMSARSRQTVARGLKDLARAGLVAERDGQWWLNDKGAAAAHAALERRRLWVAWLEHGWQVELPDAREADPRDLRGSIGDTAMAQLMELAGDGAAR